MQEKVHVRENHFHPAVYFTEPMLRFWVNPNQTWAMPIAMKVHLWKEVVHLRGEEPEITREELLSKGADVIGEVVTFAQEKLPEEPGTSWTGLILAARDATFGRVSTTSFAVYLTHVILACPESDSGCASLTRMTN